MPLAHRLELLQRERVDSAERLQVALRGAQSGSLLLAHIGDGRRHRVVVRALVAAHRCQRRHELVGTVLVDQDIHLERELGHRSLVELLQPHGELDASHLVSVFALYDGVQLPSLLAGDGAEMAQRRFSPPTPFLNRVALLGRRRLGQPDPFGQPDCGPVYRRRGPRLTAQLSDAGFGLGTGLPLVLGGTSERIGASSQGARPLLERAEPKPGVHLGVARESRRNRQPVSFTGIGFDQLGVLAGGFEPRREFHQRGPVGCPLAAALRHRLFQARCFGAGTASALRQGAQLFGQRRHLGVGVM